MNKAIFFWSPWSGPLSKGTLGNSPWRKIAPADLIVNKINSPVVTLLIKFQNSLYFLGYLSLTITGYRQLLRRRSDPTIVRLAHVCFVSIAVNVLISMATIGDNRFRVPLIGFLILLQLSGLELLLEKFRKRNEIDI